MRRSVLIIISFLFFYVQGFAQKIDLRNYANDIEVNVGIQGVPKSNQGVDIRIDMTYARFYQKGVGFRTGLTYMPHCLGIRNSVGIPILFAWRNIGVNKDAKVDINDVRKDMPYYETNDGMRHYNEFQYESFGEYVRDQAISDVSSSLIKIVSKVELNVGLTPGYIFGGDNLYYTGVDDNTTGMIVRNPFYLMADLGFKTSWRIKRFYFNINPAMHYSITDNIRAKDSDGTLSKSHRWHLSLLFGLSFML